MARSEIAAPTRKVQPVRAANRQRDPIAVIVAVIVAIGIVGRLAAYMSNPTLNVDEAMLALNLLLLGPGDMFGPLLFEQIAPVSFSLAEQTVISVAGASEYALRLLPVVCAIGVAVVTPRIATRFVSPSAVIIVAGLIAFSPLLLMYSNEVKQYSSDAGVTIGLIGLAITLAKRLESSFAWIALGIAGVLAVTASLPAVFVLAGVGSWLAARMWHRRGAALYLALAALACTWIVPAWLLYRLAYTVDPAINAYMQQFWQPAFVFSRADLSLPQQIGVFTAGTFEPLLGREWDTHPAATVFVAGGFLLGIISLIRNRGTDSLLILVPLVSAWAAYALGFYISIGRLFVFAAPLLAIVVAAGLDYIARVAPRRWRIVVAVLLIGPIFFYQVRASSISLLRQLRDNGGAIREALRTAGPDEPIYVYMRVIPDWIYYSTDWRAPDLDRVKRLISDATRAGPNSGNRPPRGHGVVREGYDRTYAFRAGWEIIGVPSGFMWGPMGFPLFASVDEGWGANEVDRIIQTRQPTAWAVFWRERVPVEAFTRAVEERGGCVTSRDHTRMYMALYKVQFPCPRSVRQRSER